MKRSTGEYIATIVAGEEVKAFVPKPLPVQAPPIEVEGRLSAQLVVAEQALARLDLASQLVPSIDWFLYAFVRKEAILSSQIEGVQATLVDLLEFESGSDQAATPDVAEVCNYVEALKYSREQLASPKGLPLSMRLLDETHRRLMHGVRGERKAPGEIRRTQNWIGGSRPGNAAFVPPPPNLLAETIASLEKYIHGKDELPLLRVGLLHVQFETIHPYLDGNGRIGRLLISLLLEHWKLLSHPLLYLSLFFKRHHAEYYRRLGAVRSEGDWEGWLDFFLDGVTTVAEEAVTAARELFATVTLDRERVLGAAATSVAAMRLFQILPAHPIVTAASAIRLLDTTKPTAGRAIDALQAAGILVETTGRRRNRSFMYRKYLDLLSTGTELTKNGGRG